MDRRSFFGAIIAAAASIKSVAEIIPDVLLNQPNTETFWDRVLGTVMRGEQFEPKAIYLALLDENSVELNPRIHNWYRRTRVGFDPAQNGCSRMIPTQYPVVDPQSCLVEVAYAVLLFGDEPVLSSPVRMSAKCLRPGDTLNIELTVSMG